MRAVQLVAMRRFANDGYSSTTVEEIAAEAGVSPITLYRHFGSKERLVLWDDFDPPILAEIGRRLPDEPPLVAVNHALTGLLDEIYDREAPLVLARAKLIQAEPALRSAAAADADALGSAVAALFERHGLSGFRAHTLAAVAVAALRVSVDEWQRHDGRTPLATLISAAFDVVMAGGAK